MLVWGQDAERGRQSSLTTLLAEVSERGMPKPSREEADRLKRDVRLSPAHSLPACLHSCFLLRVHQPRQSLDKRIELQTLRLLERNPALQR